jgi:hypothetical protein
MYAVKQSYAVDRSEVSGSQEIVNTWLRQRIPDMKELNGLDLHAYFEFKEDKALFEVENWKWYPDYDEIKALENIFKEFTDTFCGEQYDCAYAIEFIRVGEDYTDVEIKMNGNAQYRLELYRTVNID